LQEKNYPSQDSAFAMANPRYDGPLP